MPRSKISPTARTLVECRKRGWIAQCVEQTIPHTFIKRDLFGVIDIVAVTATCDRHVLSPGGVDKLTVEWPAILGIQATSNNTSGNHSARRTKILAEPRALKWIEAGGRLEVWSWAKQGARGKAKRWTLRIEAITVKDFDAGAVGKQAA